MKSKFGVAVHYVVGVVMFVMICILGDTNFNISAHIVFFAYMIYVWLGMVKRANKFISKVDSYGTWDDIRLKIYEENPDAKTPGKHSSQRYIWLARQKYDFGDMELAELKKEYMPYVVLFYSLFMAFVFKLLV